MEEQHRKEKVAWAQESVQLRETINDLQNKIKDLESWSDSALEKRKRQTSSTQEKRNPAEAAVPRRPT